MLTQGLILMCAGMGTVFLFLTVLVVAIQASSSVIRGIEARLEASRPASDDDEEMARIAGVIALGRSILKA